MSSSDAKSTTAALVLLAVLALLLAACNVLATPIDERGASQLDGALLIWHDLSANDAVYLESALDRFRAIHPEVTIVSERVPPDGFENRLYWATISGLDPDVMIGIEPDLIFKTFISDARLSPENAALLTEIIVDMSRLDLKVDNLMPRTLDAVQVGDLMLGVPYSGYTSVQYYNRELAGAPIETFDGMLSQAAEGQDIAIPTGFDDSYWGVSAFGGDLFDEYGCVSSDSALADWLNWLRDAQESPSIILNSNYDDLKTLFEEGKVAYFMGNSADMPLLQAALGPENLGVATLPYVDTASDDSGDGNPVPTGLTAIKPGSFLDMQLITMTQSSAEKALATELINFLINETQQRNLALADSGGIPVNNRFTFDGRVFPNEASLLRQRLRSPIVPLAFLETRNELRISADTAYLQAIEGIVETDEAVSQLRKEVNLNLPYCVDDSTH